MRWIAALLPLTGCSLVFEAVVAARCDPTAPFEMGQPIDAMGLSVEAARFTRGEDVAYLSLCPVELDGSVDKGGCDLYFSPYDPKKMTLSPFPMTGVNSDCYDAYPTITADGKHILFASERPVPPQEDCGQVTIWVASSANGTFSDPQETLFAGVPQGRCGNEPYVLGDRGESVYFSTVGCAGGNSDLSVTNGLPPDYAGTMAASVTSANTGQDEFAPVVTEDEQELFFARGASVADLDIYQAHRASQAEPLGVAAKASAISSGNIDWPVWVSEDACRLYYIQKPEDAKQATLFVATRSR